MESATTSLTHSVYDAVNPATMSRRKGNFPPFSFLFSSIFFYISRPLFHLPHPPICILFLSLPCFIFISRPLFPPPMSNLTVPQVCPVRVPSRPMQDLQLERKGQEEEDHRNRTYVSPQRRPETLQERFQDRSGQAPEENHRLNSNTFEIFI